MTFLIGLTGGIGSGKSTVADLFQKQGIEIVDTDQIAHQLTNTNGLAISKIQEILGKDFIDATGALDRVTVRKLIFSDANVKNKLEAILHPMIYEEVIRQLSYLKGHYALLIVPLLIEKKTYQKNIQRILVVDSEESLQITRTMQRSSLTQQEVKAIMASQVNRSSRLLSADDIINNNHDLTTLEIQVSVLHKKYLFLSQKVK